MAHNAHRGTISRRAWLLTGLAISLSRAMGSEPGLTASFDGDNLYPAGPKLHFLSGKVLERLRDSADTQTFFSQITLLIRGEQETVFKRTTQRFVVSYSIWEEKFKVSIPAPIALSKEGLTQSEAEQWTMENLAISASGLAPNQPFRMRFELRAPQQRDISNVLGNHGLSLSDSLIEFFSRKANAGDSPVSLETPWMLLRDLPRMVGRAARIG